MSSHILRSLEVAESYTRNAVFTSYSAFAVVGAIKQIAALATAALNQIRGIFSRLLNLPKRFVSGYFVYILRTGAGGGSELGAAGASCTVSHVFQPCARF